MLRIMTAIKWISCSVAVILLSIPLTGMIYLITFLLPAIIIIVLIWGCWKMEKMEHPSSRKKR